MKLFSDMRFTLSLLFSAGCLFGLSAQTVQQYWQPVAKEAVVLAETSDRPFEPHAYAALQLDFQALQTLLTEAPPEHTLAQPLLVQLPLADGTFETFALVRSAVMSPVLAASAPHILTLAGRSASGKRVHITSSPYGGFRAMIRRVDKGIEYIEPIASNQVQYYMAFDRKEYPAELYSKLPSLIDPQSLQNLRKADDDRYSPGAPKPVNDRGPLSGSLVTLRVYRFAAATTGEFSESLNAGNDTMIVLDKVVNITNQLNVIYEADLDVRLQLIDEEKKILFLNSATDPYTGTTVGGWLDQNPAAMQSTLGSAQKYDVGHVFARFLGGDALGVGSLNSICKQQKGRGCSAGFPPYGDDFLATIGQEIGHQWGGLHTWNNCDGLTEPFSGVERCEPGSGSTIMSYAGTCGGDNVQGVTDLYYHACSIRGIREYVETGEGSECGFTVITTNTAPIVSIPYANDFFIPIGTPFELRGGATDIDGDVLTYNWDEIDTGPMTALGSPVGSSPLFRSFEPDTAGYVRTFPRINTIITNLTNKTEVLPTYSRDLTFALVARDNRPGGGGIHFDTLSFRSTDQAGPFKVVSPNTNATTWHPGEYQVVTWEVANTDKAPVNCRLVNIRLSVNGGFKSPILLAENVPNTGKACVLVPNNLSPLARVRIEAADNVFFDISNQNFKILAATGAGFGICAGELVTQICLPNNYTTSISTSGWLGFNAPIALTATGLPSGASATFSPNPVAPGSTSTLTITFAAGTPESTTDVTVTGTSGAVSATTVLTQTFISNDFSALALLTPIDGAIGLSQSPALTWAGVPDADKYEIQVATSPSFAASTIKASNSNLTTNSYTVTTVLEKSTAYYWRIRPVNACNDALWTEAFSFNTLVESCTVLMANDLPKNISANSTPTVESKITVGTGGIVSDVNVKTVQGNHQFFKDLEVRVISPAGTDVLMFKDKCGNFTGNFNFGFDDSAMSPFGCPPPNNGLATKPTELLSAFNGQNANGVWTLRVKDNVIGSGGSLSGFQLELCSSAAANAPVIVMNNVLNLNNGNNAVIGMDLLQAQDDNNSADQLTFTLVSLPRSGELQSSAQGLLKLGDQFTQTDLNNGSLRYYNYGGSLPGDDFRFTVTDGEGGFTNGKFLIAVTVGTSAPLNSLRFDLAPNPASESVRLSFSEALSADTRVLLFNSTGQQIRRWVLTGGTTSMILAMGDLPKGVYAVSIENAQGRGVKKIILE